MMIENYRFGFMQIDGQPYHHDLKIIDDRVIANWFRKQGHLVLADDIADVILAAPAELVIGQGSSGFMRVSEEVRAALAERQIEMVARPTADAVKLFNQHQKQGINVAGPDERYEGGFGVYDAPEPWGPWTVVYYTDLWDHPPGAVGTFPTKWMSDDGRTLYLAFDANDGLSIRQATLQTFDSLLPDGGASTTATPTATSLPSWTPSPTATSP